MAEGEKKPALSRVVLTGGPTLAAVGEAAREMSERACSQPAECWWTSPPWRRWTTSSATRSASRSAVSAAWPTTRPDRCGAAVSAVRSTSGSARSGSANWRCDMAGPP